KASKNDGSEVFVYRAPVWNDFFKGSGAPGYEVHYHGSAIARIYFDRRGATVKALEAGKCWPEISDLDLIEIALRLSSARRMRTAAAASLN
ncbi:MAG TPA: hypothetical protein PKK31_10600, partial [Elusimicrobiales bacterium]|nr:hypothetical protein [Elusimicrobiales bacterium]